MLLEQMLAPHGVQRYQASTSAATVSSSRRDGAVPLSGLLAES